MSVTTTAEEKIMKSKELISGPNGLEVKPKLKMKFHNYGSPFCGDDIESMLVTWQD